MFFTTTKPPRGLFWDKLTDTSFQSASFHSPAAEEEVIVGPNEVHALRFVSEVLPFVWIVNKADKNLFLF